MQINYPLLASQVFGQPIFATREVVDSVKAVLEPRLLGQVAALPSGINVANHVPEPLALVDDEARTAERLQIHGKVAVIKVHGLLVARRGTITAACEELISYEHLRNQISAALRHEHVVEIVVDLHSGGGMAVGCKELADFIYQARKIKPITALVNFAAYSACYFIAAACTRIICSPTGGAGSIGVILETFEVSRWEEETGIKYNTFYRGGHKNDGSPHEPITDQATAAINKSLDRSYAMFTGSVAQYLDMDVQKVIDTQAGLMDAEEALSLGFIHQIAPAQDAIDEIFAAHKVPAPPVTQSYSVQARAASMAMQPRQRH